MKIVRHRLYVAYLLTPLLLPYLCFYFCNKLINSDFENSGGGGDKIFHCKTSLDIGRAHV